MPLRRTTRRPNRRFRPSDCSAALSPLRPVYLVDLTLPMGVTMPGLRVTLGDIVGADVLIGMDVITAGDFAITHHGGRTKMTFRIPSLSDFDFVKSVNDQGKSRKDRRAAERGPKGPKRAN